MNSVMEEVSSYALDPQEEMRLLKDKVRQLELQNKQLRRNQQRSLSPPCKAEENSKELKQSLNMSMSDEANEKSSKESSLEDLGIIDVDSASDFDEETWLAEPMTGACEASPSALEWVRGDTNEIGPREFAGNAHLSLANKLDEIAQWPSRTFDSRTFTRPRRRRPALDLEAMPTITAVETGPVELPAPPYVPPATSAHAPVSPIREAAASPGSSPPVPAPISTQTMTRKPVNVHEIARLQEESLRLSSPISSPKRTSTGSARSSELRHEDSYSDDGQDVHQGRSHNAEGDARQRLRTPPLSLPRPMEDQSPSPGNSPYGSNSSLHQISQIPNKGATRRSLPNLSRVLNGLGTRNSSIAGHMSKQLQPPLSQRGKPGQPPQPEVPGRSALPTSAHARSNSVAAVPVPASAGASPSSRPSKVGRRSLGLPERVPHASPSRMPLPSRLVPPAPAPAPPQASATPQRSGLPRPSRIPPPPSTKKRM